MQALRAVAGVDVQIAALRRATLLGWLLGLTLFLGALAQSPQEMLYTPRACAEELLELHHSRPVG